MTFHLHPPLNPVEILVQRNELNEEHEKHFWRIKTIFENEKLKTYPATEILIRRV